MGEKHYRADELVCCIEDGRDGTVLYSPYRGQMVQLNESGRRIWELLAKPVSLDEIARHLVYAYPDVPLAQARRDAENFVQSLIPDFVTPHPMTPNRSQPLSHQESRDV